jgi:DNA end-binding protein Ku
MSLQGIWSGTVSFSLVAIPVQLVRAVTPGRIPFRLLHSTDYSPLARRMFCPRHEALVPPEEIIRGYEVAPDRYLTVSDEELESLTPERSRTIEIVEFIDMNEVDPLYFKHPYYLVPLKGGEKAYQLLARAMEQTNRAGLAKFVLAEREHLVAVRSTGRALSLVTLHYSEELLAAASSPDGASVATEKRRLQTEIQGMMAPFSPAKYADGRRDKLLELLQRKLLESAPVEAPQAATEEGEGPPDLMAALEDIMRAVRSKP